ncbi:MAG: hypothetical protein HN380_03295 [Victivallales bacterium]|nr:hypothetical protein [Victivallales bacterium]
MRVPLYPLRFTPVYEQRGLPQGLFARHLAADPNRVLPPDTTGSWELVDTPAATSAIANGTLQGETFADVVRRAPREIVGRRHPSGKPFPICIRLAEHTEDQSLAVCPESPVQLNGETYLPNHRFWLSVAAIKASEISVGIRQSTTRVDFTQSLESPELRHLLQCYTPLPHDAFFAPSGRVFSIGAGNLVWELCQHAGPALEMSHWGRGEPPDPAQVDAALRAVYFQDRQVRRISRDAGTIQHTRRVPLLRHCPSFTVEEIRLYDHLFDGTNGSTYHLLAVVEGNARLETDAETNHIAAGSLVLIPAAMGDYRLYADSPPARLLRVTQQTI